MPFGEEIDAGIAARSVALSYSSATDSLRQKFTGYQKDEETSLDFAEARMYENRYGRFTAVDPLLASGKSANPQTFNRYAYVLGNPLSMTDPLGLDPWWKGNCKDGRCSYLEAKEKPTDGTWESVTFNDRGYATVGEWNTTGKTAYLYAGGGQDFGSIARFSDAMVESERQANSWNDPKLLAIRHPEVAEQGGAVMAMGVPFLNLVPGTYNLGAWGANKFGANLPYAPTLEPDENTPGLAKGFYYGANIALLAQSGVSAYRSFAAPVGKAVFWAGFPEARNAATSFSAITDGQTIEMTTGGRVLSTFSPTLRTISSRADDFLWARASSAFARQATGNVNVFMRLPVNTARTWAKVEEPILKARGINITPFFVKQ
jgi:RHS repeat-associated protein